jgi:hypothetical protein
MSRATVVLSAGVAVLVYRSLTSGPTVGWDPDARHAVTRTAPPEREPLRPEVRLPRPRSGTPVLR